jgi:hypothetical protein
MKMEEKTNPMGELLDPSRTTGYRANVARVNYLAADRPDIAYSVKELARKMVKPDEKDEEKVRRLARYLRGKPRTTIWYKYQEDPGHVQIYSDSDWAGCKLTRRSTSGGCIMYGSHYIKGWSKTQAVRALSSAEAELYSAVKASAEALGIVSTYRDFGVIVEASVLGDANAALGIIRRKGIGKMRHLNTNLLWVQEKSANKELTYTKVAGKENPADLYTKFLSGDDMTSTSTWVGWAWSTSRAATTLHSRSIAPRTISTAMTRRSSCRGGVQAVGPHPLHNVSVVVVR